MIKIFLLTKNERLLIEDWIKYHAHCFGFDNIYILDGSDDKEVLSVYNKYTPMGLNVVRSSANLNQAADELNQLMHAHKGKDNFLIKLDTDEFLAYTKPIDNRPLDLMEGLLRKFSTLADRFDWKKWPRQKDLDTRHAGKTLHVEGLNDQLEKLPITGQRYKASFTAWSIPRDQLEGSPCRNLTEFSQLQYTSIKSFFHSSNFVSVDLGCHKGATTQNLGAIDTGLTIIHYHSISIEDTIKRAEKALASHGYFTMEDDLSTKKEKLEKIRATGKCSSYHKIDLYLQHIESQGTGEIMSPSILNMFHPFFRPGEGSRDITLIKDTLDDIDNSNSLHLYRPTGSF